MKKLASASFATLSASCFLALFSDFVSYVSTGSRLLQGESGPVSMGLICFTAIFFACAAITAYGPNLEI